MKIISLVQIALITVALSACSTVKQINTDFKGFCNTYKKYNLTPKTTKVGWSLNCDYCAPLQKCKWYKCPNKN